MQEPGSSLVTFGGMLGKCLLFVTTQADTNVHKINYQLFMMT